MQRMYCIVTDMLRFCGVPHISLKICKIAEINEVLIPIIPITRIQSPITLSYIFANEKIIQKVIIKCKLKFGLYKFME